MSGSANKKKEIQGWPPGFMLLLFILASATSFMAGAGTMFTVMKVICQ